LPPLGFSFREYVLAERAQRDSPPYQTDLRYWQQRITTLPAAAELPLLPGPKPSGNTRFTRYQDRLDPLAWAQLKKLCASCQITTAGLLLSCFMEVLSRWSKS